MISNLRYIRYIFYNFDLTKNDNYSLKFIVLYICFEFFPQFLLLLWYPHNLIEKESFPIKRT